MVQSHDQSLIWLGEEYTVKRWRSWWFAHHYPSFPLPSLCLLIIKNQDEWEAMMMEFVKLMLVVKRQGIREILVIAPLQVLEQMMLHQRNIIHHICKVCTLAFCPVNSMEPKSAFSSFILIGSLNQGLMSFRQVRRFLRRWKKTMVVLPWKGVVAISQYHQLFDRQRRSWERSVLKKELPVISPRTARHILGLDPAITQIKCAPTIAELYRGFLHRLTAAIQLNESREIQIAVLGRLPGWGTPQFLQIHQHLLELIQLLPQTNFVNGIAFHCYWPTGKRSESKLAGFHYTFPLMKNGVTEMNVSISFHSSAINALEPACDAIWVTSAHPFIESFQFQHCQQLPSFLYDHQGVFEKNELSRLGIDCHYR